MNNIYTWPLSLIFIFFITSCSPDVPHDPGKTEIGFDSKDATKASRLVSVQEAKEIMDADDELVIFEISKKEKYEQGHLPNAIQLWRPDYGNKGGYEYGGMMGSREEIETLLGSKGVKANSEILLYDTKGGSNAFRVAWIFDMYGHEKVKVINGGKAAWKQAGHALTKDVTNIEATPFKFLNEPNFRYLATMEDVKAAILDTNTILLDTRESEEYKGQPYVNKGVCRPYKKGAFAAGCIPTAIHLNWSHAVDLKTDHRFKSQKDLRYNFAKAGVTPDKKIITYCQSGTRSSNTIYVLTEILGYPNVKNYDGSWIEWSYHYAHGKQVEIEQHISPEEHALMLAALEETLIQKTESK